MELLGLGDHGWGDEMIRAALTTLLLSISAMLLGLFVGILGAASKLAHSQLLRLAGGTYTTIVRGIPELLIIYLLFFGGSGAAMTVARVFGYTGYIELNAFAIGTVAIGFISGAYSTEVLRGAFLAVPSGQIEAAKACGMSGLLMFRRIMFPQVARYALPGIGNVWQLTLKDTALISVTGLVEVMRQAHVAAGSTRSPFIFFLAAAVIYLALTTVSNHGFSRAESWAGRGVRRPSAESA